MKASAAVLALLCSALPLAALGVDISLHGGAVFGPGSQGGADLANGSLNNVIFTGPFSGSVPFFNNGAAAPNVLAEALQGGPVDGLLSDGSKINENVNGAFVLPLMDAASGRTLQVLVASVSEEIIGQDAKNNLIFDLNVKFDPLTAPVAASQTRFTTGAVRVPRSWKTQNGMLGGTDRAGAFESGRIVIGRLGDFDRDGFLDGVFVLSSVTPPDLVMAEGDPLVVLRSFHVPLPVSHLDASLTTLAGIVQNFPDAILETAQQGNAELTIQYLEDIGQRLLSAAWHSAAIHPKGHEARNQARWISEAKVFVHLARKRASTAIDAFHSGDPATALERSVHSLAYTGAALRLLLAAQAIGTR